MRFWLIIFCFAVISFAEEFKIPYSVYMRCNYNAQNGQFCDGTEQLENYTGTVVFSLDEIKDIVVFTSTTPKLSLIIKARNSGIAYDRDNEKVFVVYGYDAESEYTITAGKTYFKLQKEKYWTIIFSNINNNSKIDDLNFGSLNYNFKRATLCKRNIITDRYDKDCEDIDINSSGYFKTTKSNGKLYLTTLVMEEKVFLEVINGMYTTNANGDNVLILTVLGINETESEHIILGPNYVNIIDSSEAVFLSEVERLNKRNPGSVSGSAVAITPEILITNSHVVDGLEGVALYLDGEYIPTNGFEIIHEFPQEQFDLTILKVKNANLNACPISANEPVLGEDVLVYGYPQIELQGADLKVTKGIVSGKRGFQGDESSFQIDAAVQYGNSGGPVVANKKIIGLATAILNQSQNVNFAIKASIISILLNQYGVRPYATTTDFSKCTYLLIGE